MQKKFIALAVAALASGAAFAQSNVQIYGVADVAVGSFKGTGDKFNGVINSGLSGSRLGFKGTEDLGNGLKAVFLAESTVNFDSNSASNGGGGAGGMFGQIRQSYVGLTGNFGTAVAGRLQTPLLDWSIKYSPLGGSALNPLDRVLSAYASGGNNQDRVDNAVAYISPNLSGFTLKAAYAFVVENKDPNVGATTPKTVRDSRSAYLLSADYDNGPLSVGAFYRKLGDQQNVTLGAADTVFGSKQWGLAGIYDFKVAKAFATYQRINPNGSNALDTTAYSLGVAVPVSAAGSVIGTYARAKTDAAVGAADTGASSYTIAYAHSLSKRTTAYAGYSSVDGRSNTVVNYAGLAGTSADQAAGDNVRGFAVGLRHSF